MIKCPNCGKQVTSNNLYCPYCGNRLLSDPYSGHIVNAISISGAMFEVSSPIVVTPSFTKIASLYDDDINAKILLDKFKEKKVDEDKLRYYQELGYLKRIHENRYELTDIGKHAYDKNKEFRKKVDENIENINI